MNKLYDDCESTNDLLKSEALKGCPNGSWIASRVQTKGRGRQGKAWIGLDGNLFLSVLLRFESNENLTWVPLAIGISLAHFLKSRFLDLKIQIKWPNDLLVQHSKLAGILCETVQSTSVIAGIGLNCAKSPSIIDQPTINLSEALNRTIIAEDLLPELPEWIFNDVKRVNCSELSRKFEQLSLFKLKDQLNWKNANGSEQFGIYNGLGPLGELRALSSTGTECSLFSEEVRQIRSSNEKLL